ncbi:MAG: T9SS type A sorting domain-containing protein, partial [Bacteroidales bacterium]|nr:T9SS type A sorting domain-containing protein [Bacteroidales bacterium]
PDMPVRWAMYHPQSARQVMLATELGVWTTNDAGADEVIWTQDAGMPNVRVDMLQMRESDNTVLAATHGRGLMYCTWDYNPPVFIPEKRPLEISIYPNPASNYLRFNNTEEKNLKLELLTLDGRLVLEKILLEEEEADISHLSEGTYVARLISEHGSRSEKLIIQR